MSAADDQVPEIVLVARRLGVKNSKLCVHLDWIKNAQGEEVKDYMVVTSADTGEDRGTTPLTYNTGVSILPIMNNQVGLLKVFRHPMREQMWEVPRGFVEWGEVPAHAARRELREETGLETEPQDIVELGMFIPEGGVIRARNAIFAALNCVAGGEAIERDLGIVGLSWIPIRDALLMADRSVIQDASTCIALYRYARHAGINP